MNRICLSFTARAIGIAILGCIGQTSTAGESLEFEKHILPIFYQRCFACHSQKPTEPKGELRLDSAREILESGTVVPGHPEASELLARISLPHTDEAVMPPLKGGGLACSEAERALLGRWIAEGAAFGNWVQFNHRGASMSVDSASVTRADVPQLVARLNELVQRHHAARGSKLHAPASDETWLRRVYLDVAGRIPSLAESHRFLTDKAANKRTMLIDSLLDSEAYVSHTFNWKADQLRLVSGGLPGQPGWLYDDWVKNAIRSHMAYDEFVRRLITASGYLWENGAVGFYLRDLGMPLDHMSNMARVFLGTRIECAQCHDHPLEPVTQKDFYQLAAYTYGVSNLYSASGYSNDNVTQWPEIKARMNAMKADQALNQGVSRTISYLKRLTKDTEHQIRFPEDYVYDVAARGKPVSTRTLFGDEAPATLGDRRSVFAEWMVSPRNPRFARTIANRLWKRVMGMGLIEPVDSLSVISQSEHAELMDFLTQTIIRLGFDERAFLAMLLQSQLYQSDATRSELEPDASFDLRGPLLRRLSAEQLWDSMLVFLVEDLDARKSLLRHDRTELSPERLRELTAMTAEQILERAKVEMAHRIKYREHVQRLVTQREAISAARAAGDEDKARRLQAEHAVVNADFDRERNAIRMGSTYYDDETDPRWRKLPNHFVRASETPTPIPLGHFLRQFGQSDRREIDAFNKDPNTTHSLALMNGDLTRMAIEKDSFLRSQLRTYSGDEHRVRAVYRAILVRDPDATEMTDCLELCNNNSSFEADLIWALLNSPEFLFIQ